MFFLRWALCATGQPTLLQHIACKSTPPLVRSDQGVDAHVELSCIAIETLSSIPGISDLSGEDQGQLSSDPILTPPVGLSLRATPAK